MSDGESAHSGFRKRTEFVRVLLTHHETPAYRRQLRREAFPIAVLAAIFLGTLGTFVVAVSGRGYLQLVSSDLWALAAGAAASAYLLVVQCLGAYGHRLPARVLRLDERIPRISRHLVWPPLLCFGFLRAWSGHPADRLSALLSIDRGMPAPQTKAAAAALADRPESRRPIEEAQSRTERGFDALPWMAVAWFVFVGILAWLLTGGRSPSLATGVVVMGAVVLFLLVWATAFASIESHGFALIEWCKLLRELEGFSKAGKGGRARRAREDAPTTLPLSGPPSVPAQS